MKREWLPVVWLCLVLFGSIVCTQTAVQMYFYEKYEWTIALAAANVLLFPAALAIYKWGGK